MWGVVAALYATIAVAFLMVGPSNYSEENSPDLNKSVNFLYVACSCAGAMFNVGRHVAGCRCVRVDCACGAGLALTPCMRMARKRIWRRPGLHFPAPAAPMQPKCNQALPLPYSLLYVQHMFFYHPVFLMLPQTGAVFVAAYTYALTALVDDDKLLAWVAFTRNPRHMGLTNCVTLQACGNYMLIGSILSLVYLLHGPYILIMASCILAFLMGCNLAAQAFMVRGYHALYKKA